MFVCQMFDRSYERLFRFERHPRSLEALMNADGKGVWRVLLAASNESDPVILFLKTH